MGSEKRHVVRKGECLSSIGARSGVPWNVLWDHPQNAELRRVRDDPNVLHEGDVVFVPAAPATVRTAAAATGAAHRFEAKIPVTYVRLQLVGGGTPRARKRYVLELDDGTRREGTTDGDGCVVEKVPASARRAVVRLECADLGAEEYVLKLGHLDPATEVRGIQQRLRNLGFHCELTGEADDDTRSALALFQEERGLEATGELDAATRDALTEVHGS